MDFRIIGERKGKRLWYRWQNGNITTNDEEGLAFIRDMAELKTSGYQFGGPIFGRFFPHAEFFTDPLAFRVIVTHQLMERVEKIEGDAPPLPKTGNPFANRPYIRA